MCLRLRFGRGVGEPHLPPPSPALSFIYSTLSFFSSLGFPPHLFWHSLQSAVLHLLTSVLFRMAQGLPCSEPFLSFFTSPFLCFSSSFHLLCFHLSFIPFHLDLLLFSSLSFYPFIPKFLPLFTLLLSFHLHYSVTLP